MPSTTPPDASPKGACEDLRAHARRWIVWKETAADSRLQGGANELVQVEDRLGCQRITGPAAFERETAVERGQLVGVELAELDVAEVGGAGSARPM